MEVVFRSVAGLDVHKKTVVACIRCLGESGGRNEVRTFGTTTGELRGMASWLAEHAVTHVAMESTGVFWKPIYNVLEDRFEVLLVNAQHIKQVPGRKTDVRDCEWIAQLLQCGLLRASFVPAQRQREMRDLTRHRARLSQQRSSTINRIQKILEDANVKLASVASDVLGVSGRSILEAMIRGETSAEKLAALARGRLRQKVDELCAALEGKVTDHHRFMLRTLLDEIDFFDRTITEVSRRIEEQKGDTFRVAEKRIDEIPGIARIAAEDILAEIGTDMSRFPSAQHLASWGAVCPGNNESAGKRKSGRAPGGNRWLKRALTEAAWAASHCKGTFFQARYHRLAARRGRKRALVALSHSLLTAIYSVLARDVAYRELGADHLDKHRSEHVRRYYLRKLRDLGVDVTLTPAESVA
jgi:transposase